MKFIFSLFIIGIIAFLPSCSGQKDSTGKKLSSDEERVLEAITKDLEGSSSELISYEIYTDKMPLIFNGKLFNTALTARLQKFDYEKEKERIENITFENLRNQSRENFQKRINNIDTLQINIANLYKDITDNNPSEKEFIISLVTYQIDNGFEKNSKKAIVVVPLPLDEEINLWKAKIQNIDYDYVQVALAITHSLNGTLFNYETQEKQNLDSLANTVNDPILKFILKPIHEN